MATANFYIGQKVRYLNQVGEGVITRITSQNILVEDSSGFEIPFQAKELVPANSEEMQQPITTPVASVAAAIQVNQNIAKKFLSNGIYVLVVNLQEQGFEFLLVNESEFNVSLHFYLQASSMFVFQNNAQLKSQQQMLFAKIKKEELGDWQNVAVQMIFSKARFTKVPDACMVVKKLDGKKILDPQYYFQSKYHLQPVFDICLHSDQMKEEDIEIDEKQISQFFMRDSVEAKKSKPNYVEDELIIDLHIEELIDNFTSYTPSTLIQIQTNKIKSEIEKAYTKNRREIIFIHGIGKGVLKTELIRILKSYPKIKYEDAPYTRFGFGATRVELH